jgi:hypothetical protein
MGGTPCSVPFAISGTGPRSIHDVGQRIRQRSQPIHFSIWNRKYFAWSSNSHLCSMAPVSSISMVLFGTRARHARSSVIYLQVETARAIVLNLSICVYLYTSLIMKTVDWAFWKHSTLDWGFGIKTLYRSGYVKNKKNQIDHSSLILRVKESSFHRVYSPHQANPTPKEIRPRSKQHILIAFWSRVAALDSIKKTIHFAWRNWTIVVIRTSHARNATIRKWRVDPEPVDIDIAVWGKTDDVFHRKVIGRISKPVDVGIIIPVVP